jgi:bacterioferritin-associated ferredoxin
MYVCICKRVSDRELNRAIESGADTVHAVGEATGAGTDCGCCMDAIAGHLKQARAPRSCNGGCASGTCRLEPAPQAA